MKLFLLFIICFFYSFGFLLAQSKIDPSSKKLMLTQNSKIQPKSFSGETPNFNPLQKASLTVQPKTIENLQAKKVANKSSSLNNNTSVSPLLSDVNYLHEYIKTTEALIDKLKDSGLTNTDRSLLKAESALENAKLKLAFLNN